MAQAVSLSRAFAWQGARRALLELGLRALPKRQVLAAVGGLSVVALVLAASVGWTLRRAEATPDRTTFIAVAVGVGLVIPWFFGSLGAQRLAALSVDPSHELVRPALRSDGVLTLAKLVAPAVATILAVDLMVLTVAATAGWLGWPLAPHVLLAFASYTALVVTLRVLSMSARTWVSSRTRRGRGGFLGRGVLAVVQVVIAFATPHVIVLIRDSREWPSVSQALASAGSAMVGPWSLAAQLVVLAASLGLASRIPRLLDTAARALKVETNDVALRLEHAARLHLSEPGLSPRQALSRVGWARVRRVGGPLVAPALSSVTFGLVMAAFVIGLQGAGLLFPSGDNPGVTAVHGLSLSVIVLLSLEMSSAGVVRLTSPDADRTAMDLISRIPGAYEASIHAKASQHALLVGVPLVGLLWLILLFPAGWTLPTFSASFLVCVMVTMSVVEHVGAPAVYPRRDWATIEQVGQHPRAKVWGLALTMGSMILIVPASTAMHLALDSRVPAGPLPSLGLVGLAIGLGVYLAPRMTTRVVRRWG